MLTPPPYVAVADPTRWVVKHGARHEWALRRLGFHRWLPGLPFEKRPGRPLPFEAMGALAMQLRDLGVAFSAGRDWSPAEVVRFLRDEGHFVGAFVEISWGQGEGWTLHDHPEVRRD